MTLKTLSAIAIVTAALGSPAFAQDQTLDGLAYHKPAYTRHFRNSYDQAPMSEPGYYAGPRAGGDWYGLDRSRVGDRDPDFNPPGS
jgi:hypothetical protein